MRNLVDSFDNRFAELNKQSAALVERAREKTIFFKSDGQTVGNSFGEYILRSAGRVEQTFGGLTASLWDDPFEWTLPEELSTRKKILEYLSEVEDLRKKGFTFFKSDDDLVKDIAAPGGMLSIFDLLLDTLVSASIWQERAFSALKI